MLVTVMRILNKQRLCLTLKGLIQFADTCAAVAKTMEQSLRLYFDSQDIGKRKRKDPRAEPCNGESIPYIVIHGEPGSRLVDIVVNPMEVLGIDSPLRLNELYYISKQIIPSLQRVFGLVGTDLNRCFAEMLRPMREIVKKHSSSSPNAKRTRIDYYYLSNHCIICGDLVPSSIHICSKCSCNSSAVASYTIENTSRLEGEMQHLAGICRHCGDGDWIVESGVKCTSFACPVFYERHKVQMELRGFSAVATEGGFYPKCMGEWFYVSSLSMEVATCSLQVGTRM